MAANKDAYNINRDDQARNSADEFHVTVVAAFFAIFLADAGQCETYGGNHDNHDSKNTGKASRPFGDGLDDSK